jgi:type II secretory pathway component PulM
MDDPEEIGGYRVLRRLARGGRAEILLAHGGDPPGTVVIKRAAADDPSAVREVDALDRGAGEHVVGLLDVSGDDGHLDLVLESLPGGDLARILAARSALEGGEAVTLLAPLAATVRRLHDAGVAHGALTPGTVLFRDDGTPVLAGFGAAAVFAPGAPEVVREEVAQVAADRAAVRRLADAVLGRVDGSRRRAALALLGEIAAADDARIVALLEERIFEIATPRPVRDADEPTAPAEPGMGRLIPVAPAVQDGAGGAEPHAGSWAARVEGMLERAPGAELRAALVRRWAGLAPRRRRLLLGVGAGLVALVVAFVAVPGPATGSADARPRSPSAATPSGRATASGSPAAGGDSRAPALRGDDPIAAATALLAARAACRRELSVLCLDAVDQDGSAAAKQDIAAIRAAQGGGELGDDPLATVGEAAPQLRERLGGSALVTLSGGASMLLLRTPSGWRIRDILAAPPPAAP